MQENTMTNESPWYVAEIDNGYCRVVYQSRTSAARICFQLESVGNIPYFVPYELTDWDEPLAALQVKDINRFPLPDGDSSIERDYRIWREALKESV